MDEVGNNQKKDIWSYSRVTCFGRCKYEFYLDYIVNDDDLYLSEGNYYAEVGSFVHKILEKMFKGEISPEDTARYFVENYDMNVCYEAKQSVMDKAYNTCLDYFINADFDWINKYDILGVEMKQRFTIEDYDFVGYIDLLLRDKSDGKIVVLDHKSAPYPLKTRGDGVKKNQLQSFLSYKKQMYLYCNAIYQQFGEYPKEITWNHFKENKFVTIPFKKEEYEESIRWFIETVKEIEQEQNFDATPDFFYCTNLCNFRHSCEYQGTEKEN